MWDSLALFEMAEEPDFESAQRVHDWRNYISERMKKRWSTLSLETRIDLILDANDLALVEDWD